MISEIASERNLHRVTHKFGEQVTVKEPQASCAWWRDVEANLSIKAQVLEK